MTDSIPVLPPGFRATDPNGVPLSDGIISFFDAGTNNPRQVYSNLGLTLPLGTTVTCNSSGVPVSSSNVPTLIYTGPTPYKVRLSSATLGGTVFEYDNVAGALDTSGFLTTAFVPNHIPVNISDNHTLVAADKGKLFNGDCSSGVLTMTVDDAADLGLGWWVGIRHDGNANQIKIVGNGTDLFGLNGARVLNFALTGRGHTVYFVCDGTGFKIFSEVTALIGNNVGVIRVVSRTATPPTSLTPGDRYIVLAGATGAWATFAQHAIAETDGAGWFQYIPPTDCGWVAYVQNEDANYQFRNSAWVDQAATNAALGLARYATVNEVFNHASLVTAVPPGLMYVHPGVPKFVASISWSGGTPTLQTAHSYNVTSIVDNGVGDVTLNLGITFSNTLWGCSVTSSASDAAANPTTRTANTVRVLTFNSSDVAVDPDLLCVTGYGTVL